MYEPMWWFSAAMYWVAAGFCVWAARKNQLRRWWRYGAAAIGILGVNKLFSISSMVTAYLRDWALRSGWYPERTTFQIWVVGGLLAVAVIGAVWLISGLSKKGWTEAERLSALSILLLSVFSLVRSVSLHMVDALLYRPVYGIRPNWIFELGGIGLAMIAAILAIQNGGHSLVGKTGPTDKLSHK